MSEWIKSLTCNLGNSILVKVQPDGSVLIRDTEDPDGEVHAPRASWHAFVAGIRAGDFDCTLINPEAAA